MYKKIKNYKSLMSKVRYKGKWHFNPMVKSNDAKYLGRIKLSKDIINGAIRSVDKTPFLPAVQLFKKDLINLKKNNNKSYCFEKKIIKSSIKNQF